ncbi:MAG: SPFH domain-containing protein [Verrucomicrobia bacterium]|nr:SPFH domain-containing protein [Verrucomicrobiota bacterium]
MNTPAHPIPPSRPNPSRERIVSVLPGAPMLLGVLLLAAWLVFQVVQIARFGGEWGGGLNVTLMITELAAVILAACGFFTLQPNEARVLVLFGSYKGTVRRSGFHWTNPFTSMVPVSLRSRNLNGERLKVNDKRGNPIEIAAVVVWHIEETAQAAFDVQNVESYVAIQSESAVRHLASSYAYDHGEEHEVTLRGGGDEVSAALLQELSDRLSRAGVVVEEARISHLAYAPEIASAMLRRQQAEAVIAARQKIVQGAVSMVEMALRELDQKNLVDLDPERRAAMVSNLLVVLCGETEVQPVVNTGTLHH